jgi:hypothetical protein
MFKFEKVEILKKIKYLKEKILSQKYVQLKKMFKIGNSLD